jgi:hypothetical protein
MAPRDARMEPDGFDIEATDSVDQTQSHPDRPLGIVLMCSRVAEIDQNAVPHVFRDKARGRIEDKGCEARGRCRSTGTSGFIGAKMPALGWKTLKVQGAQLPLSALYIRETPKKLSVNRFTHREARTGL